MRIYLAGPMRNIPEHNFPEFYRVAALLEAAGHEVFNPAKTDDVRKSQGLPTGIRDVLGDDLAWVCAYGEAIALLDGFAYSLGADAEIATGRAIGLKIETWRAFL